MQTHSGAQFYPFDVRPGDFDIEDIAHALSNQCRFAGHTREFYSVAQHSVLVSNEVERLFGKSHPMCVEWSLLALLHDAPEAYIGDLVRPIKETAAMAPYRLLDHEIGTVLAEQFKLDNSSTAWGVVKACDDLLLAWEARDLMGDPEWAQAMPSPPPEKIEPWTMTLGRAVFLSRFSELTRLRAQTFAT